MIPGGKFTIIDSAWSKEIASVRSHKAGMIKRALRDGREFEIYKRYFEKQDLYALAERNNTRLEIKYFGKVFFLANGCFINSS